jgi:hypothetical protein
LFSPVSSSLPAFKTRLGLRAPSICVTS